MEQTWGPVCAWQLRQRGRPIHPGIHINSTLVSGKWSVTYAFAALLQNASSFTPLDSLNFTLYDGQRYQDRCQHLCYARLAKVNMAKQHQAEPGVIYYVTRPSQYLSQNSQARASLQVQRQPTGIAAGV